MKPSELIKKLQMHIDKYGDEKDVEVRFAFYDTRYDELSCATDRIVKLYAINGAFTLTTHMYEGVGEPLLGDFEEEEEC